MINRENNITYDDNGLLGVQLDSDDVPFSGVSAFKVPPLITLADTSTVPGRLWLLLRRSVVPSSGITVAFWMKKLDSSPGILLDLVETADETPTILSDFSSRFLLEWDVDQKLKATLQDGSSVTSFYTHDLTTWTHLAITFKEQTILYSDGVQIKESGIGLVLSFFPVYYPKVFQFSSVPTGQISHVLLGESAAGASSKNIAIANLRVDATFRDTETIRAWSELRKPFQTPAKLLIR